MLPLESASAEDGAGSQERIAPKWEESAEKVGGLRGMNASVSPGLQGYRKVGSLPGSLTAVLVPRTVRS